MSTIFSSISNTAPSQYILNLEPLNNFSSAPFDLHDPKLGDLAPSWPIQTWRDFEALAAQLGFPNAMDLIKLIPEDCSVEQVYPYLKKASEDQIITGRDSVEKILNHSLLQKPWAEVAIGDFVDLEGISIIHPYCFKTFEKIKDSVNRSYVLRHLLFGTPVRPRYQVGKITQKYHCISDIYKAVEYFMRNQHFEAALHTLQDPALAPCIKESLKKHAESNANIIRRKANGETLYLNSYTSSCLIHRAASMGRYWDSSGPLDKKHEAYCIKILERLLALDVDINQPYGAEVTALGEATYVGSVTIVSYLLNRGAIPKSQGYGSLNSAIEQHQFAIARLLLEKGAEFKPTAHDPSDPYKMSTIDIINWAVQNNDQDAIEFTRLLEQKGISTNSTNIITQELQNASGAVTSIDFAYFSSMLQSVMKTSLNYADYFMQQIYRALASIFSSFFSFSLEDLENF